MRYIAPSKACLTLLCRLGLPPSQSEGSRSSDAFSSKSTPTCIKSLAGKHIVDAACGSSHSVCVTATGEVLSWGNNKFHLLGLGPGLGPGLGLGLGSSALPSEEGSESVAVPTRIPKLVGLKVTAVSCGAGHTICICGADGGTGAGAGAGRAFGWGINQQGQLGVGLDSEGAVINRVSEPQLVLSPLATDGPGLDPNPSPNPNPVVSVACGIAHTMFLHADGRISACGLNNYGQLGLGRRSPPACRPPWAPSADGCNLHRLLYVPLGGLSVAHIACGGAHTLLVDSSGVLLSCGSNSCGQLGDGSLQDSDSFRPLPPCYLDRRPLPLSFAYCACGEEFSAAITRSCPNPEQEQDQSVRPSSEVLVWGLGIAGQMGDGTLDNRTVPSQVRALSGRGVELLACSQGQLLAVTGSGEVRLGRLSPL